MSEIDKIHERYSRRVQKNSLLTKSGVDYFVHYMRCEREFKATRLLIKHLGDLSDKKVLEVGAGSGDNALFLKRTGFDWNHIYLNELLPQRLSALKSWFPKERIFEGDICQIKKPDFAFDLIFQSTVFSSVLDQDLRHQMINQIKSLLKPGGYFLWYDFIYNNPSNPDVAGIPVKEVQALCSGFELIASEKVTLLPPLGRRVGRLYPVFNTLFTFLRTHRLLLFKKPTNQN
jgi:SAM-dependent methyltransferase